MLFQLKAESKSSHSFTLCSCETMIVILMLSAVGEIATADSQAVVVSQTVFETCGMRVSSVIALSLSRLVNYRRSRVLYPPVARHARQPPPVLSILMSYCTSLRAKFILCLPIARNLICTRKPT